MAAISSSPYPASRSSSAVCLAQARRLAQVPRGQRRPDHPHARRSRRLLQQPAPADVIARQRPRPGPAPARSRHRRRPAASTHSGARAAPEERLQLRDGLGVELPGLQVGPAGRPAEGLPEAGLQGGQAHGAAVPRGVDAVARHHARSAAAPGVPASGPSASMHGSAWAPSHEKTRSNMRGVQVAALAGGPRRQDARQDAQGRQHPAAQVGHLHRRQRRQALRARR